MHIIYDEHNEEYGVLKNKPFKDIYKDTCKKLKKQMPNMTPDNIFYTEEEIELPNKEQMDQLPVIDIPTVHFYGSDKKVYDTALYTSQNAKDRYKIIKKIKNLKEFFKFKKEKTYS